MARCWATTRAISLSRPMEFGLGDSAKSIGRERDIARVVAQHRAIAYEGEWGSIRAGVQLAGSVQSIQEIFRWQRHEGKSGYGFLEYRYTHISQRNVAIGVRRLRKIRM